jgi:hypothetical protein
MFRAMHIYMEQDSRKWLGIGGVVLGGRFIET